MDRLRSRGRDSESCEEDDELRDTDGVPSLGRINSLDAGRATGAGQIVVGDEFLSRASLLAADSTRGEVGAAAMLLLLLLFILLLLLLLLELKLLLLLLLMLRLSEPVRFSVSSNRRPDSSAATSDALRSSSTLSLSALSARSARSALSPLSVLLSTLSALSCRSFRSMRSGLSILSAPVRSRRSTAFPLSVLSALSVLSCLSMRSGLSILSAPVRSTRSTMFSVDERYERSDPARSARSSNRSPSPLLLLLLLMRRDAAIVSGLG